MAEVRPRGSCLYSPPCHSGSLRIESVIMRRIIRFRPAISAGRIPGGTFGATKSAGVPPPSPACLRPPPIGVPNQSPRLLAPDFSQQHRVRPPAFAGFAEGGKARVRPVGRLAQTAVPNPVGQDDEIPRRVEQTAATEEHACELWSQERAPRPARAVHDEDGVAHHTSRVAHGSPDGRVVQLQFRQRLVAPETKIAYDVIAFA